VPEQGVGDGKGMLYVVMQDPQGSVTAVDAKTMKAVAHYPLGDRGRCNGLALDVKNRVLFAACGNSGNPPTQPAQPMMVILSAVDGKVLTSLPLAGGSDGAAFNPSTMEAFSTHGNGTLTVVKEKSPTSFEVAQNLETMNGARTITFDSKTNHILTMSQERGPAPPPPPGGGRGVQGTPVPGSDPISHSFSAWRHPRGVCSVVSSDTRGSYRGWGLKTAEEIGLGGPGARCSDGATEQLSVDRAPLDVGEQAFQFGPIACSCV